VAHLFYPPFSRELELAERIHEAQKMSPAGEPLDFGGRADLEVTLKAQGLRQTGRFRLGFDADGPTVEPY
jgi:hypothetical protein